MDFILKCEIYKRLISVTDYMKPSMGADDKERLSCVYLEYKDGHYYAVSTNRQLASVYYLGEINQPDAHAFVVRDDRLIKQCDFEMQYDSSFVFTVVPEIAVGTARTLMGWEMEGNCCIFPEFSPQITWRDWGFPDKTPQANNGVMYWDISNVTSLAATSPSGKVYFPQHIDVKKPVVIRDIHDDNWCGMFMADPCPEDKQVTKPAEIPTWI